MRERKIMTLALGAVLLVAAACSSNSATDTTAPTTTTTTATTTTAPPTSASGSESANVVGKTTFTIDAKNLAFDPNALIGSPGQALQIRVENKDTVPHNFSIDSQHINILINPGEEQEIDVTFPQSGSVQFYCVFHRTTNNMVGTLSVG
jgi:nitrosocyanin